MSTGPTTPGTPNPPSTPAPAIPGYSSSGLQKTLERHPRALGGDPVRNVGAPVLSLSDRVINNQSSGPHYAAAKRKPSWLRAKVPGGPEYLKLKNIIDTHRLHTVCEEASCPNLGECWARGVATIMILGDTCTRSCGFCNVKTGKPPVLDLDEPRRVADSLRLMWEGARLKHIVITSVNRDELDDGGAALWAETIVRSRELCPGMSIEVLIPDFLGDWNALQKVIDARPDILNHNLETVRRMYPVVRPQAKFDRSVELLKRCKDQGLVTKTGIMVGIGERDDEVLALMDDVQQRAGIEILTIGQYLQPTPNHLPIDRWVTPEQFTMFHEEGIKRGFKVVESGALVRSSYHADHQADSLTDILKRR
ncbi:MAG: lipoyl synthase [Planctomycetes bacterium]|nr:lipoyl synthase [Planctomycetota bacterium]